MFNRYKFYRKAGRLCCYTAMLLAPAMLVAQDGLMASARQVNRTSLEKSEARSLRDALDEVQNYFHVSFIYESAIVEGKEILGKVPLKGKVESTLARLLEPVGLKFKKINDRTYSIFPKTPVKATRDGKSASAVENDISALLFTSTSTEIASTLPQLPVDITVSGIVTDESNNAIPGANVLLKGTSRGTTTDVEGKFTLNVPDENAVLVVTFIGYSAQEITVGGQTNINIKLNPDTQQLSEVVVIGYGTQKRSSVTGAVASVSAKDVTALPVPSVGAAIQGRIPGVQVTNNGSPGTTPTILIRGVGSITGISQPLYVIDGFPAATNLNNIDTKDIESVEVLKDAAASAIYGSRAANGVIIITTKNGSRDNKVHVEVDSYYGVQKAWKQLDLLQTNDYLKYGTALLTNADADLPQRFSEMNTPIYAGTTQTYAQTETDWQDAMFRSAPISQVQVSLSAGTDKSKVYTSISKFDQEGIMLGTNFNRYSMRLNYETKISERFTFGENLSISTSRTRNQAESGGRTILQHIIRSVPYMPIYDPTRPGGFRAPSGNDGSDPENPVRIATMDANKDNMMNLIGRAYIDAKIVKGLSYRFTAGLNYGVGRHYEDLPIYNDGFGGRTTHNLVDNRSTTVSPYYSNQLTFDRAFGKHSLNIIAVAESQDNALHNLNTSAQQARNDISYMDGSSNQAATGFRNETSLLSYLARINYGFKDGKYLLSASIRRDGYSGFSTGRKWGNFPGVSLGWRLNEEDFMKAIPTISELKLRASYGALGSLVNVGAYDDQSCLKSNTTYPFNNTTAVGSYYNRLANDDLTWEKTDMLNYGIDLGLFENRITFTAEYYTRDVDALLLDVAPATSLGYTQFTKMNIGSMKNWGTEFVLGYNKSTGPLTFNLSANLGIIRNEVTTLVTPNAALYAGTNADFGGFDITRTVRGRTIQEFYGYQTDGIFQSQEEINAANALDGNPATRYQSSAAPGDIRFKDVNGDGTIDASDRTPLGSYLPKFTYGLNFSANYKNFDITLFFQGVQGNKIYNGTKVLGQGMLRLFGAQTDVLRAWTPTNTNTDVPRAVNSDPNQNSRTSDRFVENGSYLRLKNISIGYTLPTNVAQDMTKGTLKKMRVYVSAQNLITITNYSGYDPEIGNRYQNSTGNTLINGIDYGQFPSPRTVMAGLQIGF
jgi:TonB-dependent starch-binding outer membrane protein SusC